MWHNGAIYHYDVREEKVGFNGLFTWKHVFMLLNYMKAYFSMYFLHLMLSFSPQNDMVNGSFELEHELADTNRLILTQFVFSRGV